MVYEDLQHIVITHRTRKQNPVSEYEGEDSPICYLSQTETRHEQHDTARLLIVPPNIFVLLIDKLELAFPAES